MTIGTITIVKNSTMKIKAFFSIIIFELDFEMFHLYHDLWFLPRDQVGENFAKTLFFGL